LRLPQITSVLVGASRVSQIEENVAALSNPSFTQEELDEIDKITLCPGSSN
ncbi:MAG TPA: aldo/keto reductase, partial [Firmicutes bacterium]|nr:aldo/keto reductase [Bacillota bacterium]